MCLQARITGSSVLAQVNAGKLIGNSCVIALDFPMRKVRVGLPNAQGSSDFLRCKFQVSDSNMAQMCPHLEHLDA
jgi:hypothetical protein